jgi:hypothetical protein
MDEMNQFEKQLQSWMPRRPSRKIAHRLFGAMEKAAARSHCAQTWSWLAPVAACAFTILVMVQTGVRQPAQGDNHSNTAFFSAFILGDPASANVATYCMTQFDQTLEWNVWPHAAHNVAELHTAEPTQTLRFDAPSSAPTNRSPY